MAGDVQIGAIPSECPRTSTQVICDDCNCGRKDASGATVVEMEFVPVRQALAPPVRRTRKERKAYDPDTMGFGKHVYEFIDKNEVDVDTLTRPPDGEHRRDFNTSFNVPNEKTTMNLDLVCRLETEFETNMPGKEGNWVIVGLPVRIDGIQYAVVTRSGGNVVEKIPLHLLGILPERESNLYIEGVYSRRVAGGEAGRAQRERLTKQTDGEYKTGI